MLWFKRLAKNIPTLLLAVALSVAVWISAVTAADPTEDRTYNKPVTLELVGQDPGLVMMDDVPKQVTLRLSAPRSIWNRLDTEQVPIRAVADLSTLGAGPHTVPVQVQVDLRPVEIISYTPAAIDLTLEALSRRVLPIRLIQHGDPAVGYQAAEPTLSQSSVNITGPESLVNRVREVRATLDLAQTSESIDASLLLQAFDASDLAVDGLTINPERIRVTQAVTQRGGYRNVVVKVIASGQILKGYRLTNISAFPPVVTVFSSNPLIVNNLPGYVETTPVDLTGSRDDLDVRLSLNLPAGVSVVGDQTVNVQVGIAAVESSLTLANMKVEIVGLSPNLSARISPETVDVILSGPLPLLDALKPTDVRVVLPLNGDQAGTYQRVPKVELKIQQLKVESILPGSIEVNITSASQVTPTPR